MMLIQLLLIFAKIGLFAFGGGPATLPLIEKEIVSGLHWLTHSELLEILIISELTPGPLSINVATFVGYKLSGVLGGIVATIGFCLPPIVIVLIIAQLLGKFQENTWVSGIVKGLRPALVALIVAAVYSIVVNGKAIADTKGIIIGITSFLAITSRRINPIFILILAGILGIILYW